MDPTVRRLRLTVLVSLVATLLAACGGGGTTGGEATTAPAAGQATTAPAVTEATTAPAAGEATTAPAGEATTAPAAGEATTAPAAGEATTAPAAGEATTAPAAGGAAMALPAECTNVDVQFWNPFTGPDGPFMGQLVDQFNAENPNVRVTMTSQAEYYTQLSTAAASNTLPDLAIIHADQVSTQVFRNVLRPIDQIAQQIGVSSSDFPEAVWNAGEVAGKRYSIPLDIHPATMYYNEDLLKSAGFSAPPATGQEFTDAATKLTQGDNKGYMISAGFFSRQIFETLLHQYGGQTFSDDGSKVEWNSDAGVKALQWMVDAQSKFSEPNLASDEELNAFKSGTTGIVLNGIWQMTNVTGEGVEFAGKATAIPQFGDQPAVWAGSHQFALLTHGAAADPCKDVAAGMFIKYALDNSVEWAKAGQIPASNAVRNSAEFKAVEPQASIAPSVENAFFPPAVPGITDAFAPLDEAVTAVLSGTQTDVKAALDEAANRANQILTENKQNFGEAPKS